MSQARAQLVFPEMSDVPRTGQPIQLNSALLAALVSVFRGANQVAIRYALTAFAPLWTAFGRMAVSCVTVFIWTRFRGVSLRLTSAEWLQFAVLGAVFTIQISLLHWGADLTTPGYAVVLINTNPIFASLISHFFVPGDRLSRRRLAGLAVAFAGVCAVFFGRPDPTLATRPTLGNTMITISGAMVGARTVYIQRLVQKIDPAKAVIWQMLISLPCFALGGLLLGGHAGRDPFNWQAIAAVTYQGVIVGGVALVLWVHLLRRHTPGSLTVFSFLTPVFGVVLSSVAFNESITARFVVGLACVIAGIALVNWRERSAKSYPTAPA